MEKLNKKYVGAALVAVVLIVGIFFFMQRRRGGGDGVQQYTRPLGECEIKEDTFIVNDDFMVPKYKKGQKVNVIFGHYPCHAVETDDLVIYRKSELSDPVLRIVKGVPGDEYKLIKTKQNTWNIEINGDVYEVGKEPYHFGSNNPPVLSLSEKATHGVLGPTHVLIFSMVPPGYDDSGVLGVVSTSDLMGKVK